MLKKTALLGVIVLAVSAAAIAGGAMSAAAGTSSEGHTAGARLAGTWVATVNRPAPLPPLRSLQVINRDGTAIETSNEPPGSRSPMYSSWKRIGVRLYAASGVHFLFNPQTGEFTGTRKIDRTIELARDGQSLKTVARVTTLDPQGNVVATLAAATTAERMKVDPIPDRP